LIALAQTLEFGSFI